MPLVHLATNVPSGKFPEGFRKEFAAVVAKALRHDIGNCIMHIQGGQDCNVGGEDVPCAIVTVKTLWFMGEEENVGHAKAITKFLEASLGIDNANVFIHLYEGEKHTFCRRGTTIKEILRKHNESL